MALSLPPVPVRHDDFLSHVHAHPETPISNLVQPYLDQDAALRKVFAQDPSRLAAVKDNHVNVVPLYRTAGPTKLGVRARDLATETPEDKEKYILPLREDQRKPSGSPAVVPTLEEFQSNFALFTEGALGDLDWSNVIVAGSAVVTSLLPVPEKARKSKRGLRQYYHEEFAPASDVDLFLYGLTEDQAIDKIKHIEDKIRNTILYETTVVRTKNTITIVSQYPTRHVQIVLRIYHSVAEILTGFDVDCSTVAYDGKQVWASPRAIAAFISQTNQIDLTRRSPSYENRLSKYSHRGFEVFWSPLDRSRVDPTIFERSFTRTEGLARLLVLEKLPKSSDRDDYLQKRRNERGRPPVNMYLRRLGKQLRGNIKNDWEDEVPEWQEEDQVSGYHTFTIPYGRRFNARKIEKLLYTKDILLNAEWNRKKDREVHLHRHPAFIGDVDSVIGDCCGFCPQPVTDEEVKVAEEESKIYISGNVNFIKDDPGRQEIGSFNPITETEWTEMAYIGHTEKLCQAIVNKDLESIKGFLAYDDADPNRRDYTGRTPLQLACMSSSPEVVQCLVDHGARLISRMADGKTALHLAAARGDVEIIRILLNMSNENEEEEAKKQESLRKLTEAQEPESSSEDDDNGNINDNTDGVSHTSASYVKVHKTDTEQDDDSHDDIEENQLEPDIYDINTVAWDSHATPLHLAILHCRVDAVKELVSSFGADIMLPIKQINDFNKTPRAAILTLVLVLALPLDQALEMSRTLLQLGASPAQADLTQSTPLHYIAQTKHTELLDIYLEHDGPAVQRAINHLAIDGTWRSATASTALIVALKAHNSVAATKLLEAGAKPAIERDEFMKASKTQTNEPLNASQLDNLLNMIAKQPIMHAVESDMPLLALDLLRRGADPNSEVKPTWQIGKSLLDAVRICLLSLKNFIKGVKPGMPMFGFRRSANFSFEKDDEAYLAEYGPGSYKRFAAQILLEDAHKTSKSAEENKEKKPQPGVAEKKEAITRLFEEYKTLETEILARGAKTYTELHPDAQKPHHPPHQHNQNSNIQPFKADFKFPLPTVTDATREAYLDLFEAAWNGDIDGIKARTLGMWGPSKDQAPLEIAIYDAQGLSCLSIAILRGHLEAAKAILQILRLQYKEKEPQGQKRFEINSEGDTDDGASDDEGLNIVGQTVDDQFTHENVGESTNHVVSDICPLEALQRDIPVELFLDQDSGKFAPRYCPSDLADLNGYLNRSPGTHMLYGKPSNLLAYAVYKNDVPLFEFLLKIGKDLVSRYPTQRSEFLTSPKTFQLAISLGRIECLSTLIRLTGSGLPLTKLSEDSGVEATKEPRHYPGLTIRGKKRADWANAGRQEQEPRSAQRPPLLIAAFQGNLASVEWFLGTGPSRCYLEYLEAHKDDDNVHRIAQSHLGLEGTVLNWLHARNNLILHCAVMSKPCEESERLVQYLVDHHPECLEVRSQNGHTPLALAFSLHRLSFARILIRAGANQAVRDSLANNLLHLLLLSLDSKVCTNPEELSPFIGLLDQTLVSSMVLERAGETSRTPFAHWVFSLPEHRPEAAHLFLYGSTPPNKVNMDTATAVAKILLELAEPTGQKHLEFFDGAGNTPVHEAVKKGFIQILKLMFDYRPDLLYRENSTGSTPLEMATEAWVNLTTYGPPALSTAQHHNPKWRNAVSREPGHFVVDPDSPAKQEVMFRFCQEQAKQHAGKRILVSLFEANEVAKRLASTRMFWDFNQMSQYRWHRATGKEMDEITLWNRVAND